MLKTRCTRFGDSIEGATKLTLLLVVTLLYLMWNITGDKSNFGDDVVPDKWDIVNSLCNHAISFYNTKGKGSWVGIKSVKKVLNLVKNVGTTASGLFGKKAKEKAKKVLKDKIVQTADLSTNSGFRITHSDGIKLRIKVNNVYNEENGKYQDKTYHINISRVRDIGVFKNNKEDREIELLGFVNNVLLLTNNNMLYLVEPDNGTTSTPGNTIPLETALPPACKIGQRMNYKTTPYSCENICDNGKFYNRQTKSCEDIRVCTTGTFYNSQTNFCQDIPV